MFFGFLILYNLGGLLDPNRKPWMLKRQSVINVMSHLICHNVIQRLKVARDHDRSVIPNLFRDPLVHLILFSKWWQCVFEGIPKQVRDDGFECKLSKAEASK